MIPHEDYATYLESEVKKLREELRLLEERGQMQLVAISTAAQQNTDTTAKEGRIESSNPYYTTAYYDVCRLVDREIKERTKSGKILDALQKICTILQESSGQDLVVSIKEAQTLLDSLFTDEPTPK